MNRRDFGKTASLVAATAVVAPEILAQPVSGIDQIDYYRVPDEWDDATPQQLAALKRMEENIPPLWIFETIAKEIPQQVPDASKHAHWMHGDIRVFGMIDGQFPLPNYKLDLDLSKIGWMGFWRQAVRNRYTQKVSAFISTIPMFLATEIDPGQAFDVKDYVPIGTSHEDIERIARESFLKLQELVVEYHNREAA